MMRSHRRILLVTGAALLALVPGLVTAQTGVSVDLSEFAVAAQPDSAPAGAVTFEATNSGDFQHELVVIQTDLAPDALPVAGNAVDVGQLDVLADTDPFGSGESQSVNVELAEGSYVLICNVPGHYESGMRTAFTAAAGQAEETPTAEPTPEATPSDATPEATAEATPGTDTGTDGGDAEPAPATTGFGVASSGGVLPLSALVLGALTFAVVAAGRGLTGLRRGGDRQ